eukprot:TRINITY_DN981_c0_g1_i3.p1 TRINITY_DN981_c0_g1~~TRINITY_DN981_c0_g1_i3.p1  ORF type:complete len:939 (+),score=196.97 TRINITY_DN981_c0_g1_i3:1864-4680(+)
MPLVQTTLLASISFRSPVAPSLFMFAPFLSAPHNFLRPSNFRGAPGSRVRRRLSSAAARAPPLHRAVAAALSLAADTVIARAYSGFLLDGAQRRAIAAAAEAGAAQLSRQFSNVGRVSVEESAGRATINGAFAALARRGHVEADELHLRALVSGNWEPELARTMIAAYADDPHRLSAFHRVCLAGHVSMLGPLMREHRRAQAEDPTPDARLCRRYPAASALRAACTDEQTPLHIAAASRAFDKAGPEALRPLCEAAAAASPQRAARLKPRSPHGGAASGIAAVGLAKVLPKDWARDIDAQDAEGYSPLHLACLSGNAHNAAALIRAGADPTVRDHRGQTPLHAAASQPRFWGTELDRDLREVLFKSAAEAACGQSSLPLHVACSSGCLPAVTALAEHSGSAAAAARCDGGLTPLHLAAAQPAFATEEGLRVLGLLARLAGKDGVCAADDDGAHPLHLALHNDQVPQALLLLDAGADPAAVAKSGGLTPLMTAARRRAVAESAQGPELLRRLACGDLGHRAGDGDTALHMALRARALPAARVLLEQGADASTAGRGGDTALHLLASDACVEEPEGEDLFMFMLRSASGRAAAGTANEEGLTPLHAACAAGRAAAAAALLAGESGQHAAAKDGSLPLHLAAASEAFDIPPEEVSRGSSVMDLLLAATHAGSQDASGRTPLHHAAAEGRLRTVRRLLDAGADPDAVDSQGCTALHLLAARSGWVPLDVIGTCHPLAGLLGQRAAASADKDGFTPAHVAAQTGGPQAVLALLQLAAAEGHFLEEALMARTSRKRRTALHLAANRLCFLTDAGQAALQALARAAPAARTVRDALGHTPSDLARQYPEAARGALSALAGIPPQEEQQPAQAPPPDAAALAGRAERSARRRSTGRRRSSPKRGGRSAAAAEQQQQQQQPLRPQPQPEAQLGFGAAVPPAAAAERL